MDEGGAGEKPVCAQEALDLLNCVTQSPFDQDKCLHLLHSLRECALTKGEQFDGASSNDGQDALIANIGKGKNVVADHVDSSGSQGIHSSKKGQVSMNDKVAGNQLVISLTLLDSIVKKDKRARTTKIVKNQQALDDVVATLTKNPEKNHDPSME
ncbi:Cysteine alpha-hairpin motif superfamily [Senna tora]|uniref:Cysteine alpha-hairpin motif superfamily n=1 Tax=Senna tora TaxID=362788 RepID=A0A834W5E5_9FABA|nr:Cysteine alpha-hairpin motif superfamily [Senna tora]